MYNKLFTKILDSSIWLEPTSTRIVWLTMIAAMDETGFVQFASVANLAHRAVVPVKEAEKAVDILEGQDANSSDPENEGRRIERVPGGWMVLNAQKYRLMATRVVIQEQTRERVRRHREKKAECNAPVTQGNEVVTPSDTDTDSKTESDSPPLSRKREVKVPEGFTDFWQAYPKKVGKGDAVKAWKKHGCKDFLPQILTAVRKAKISSDWTKKAGQYIPHPAKWLNRQGWEDELAASYGNGHSRAVCPPHNSPDEEL